ncbi:MAG: hypothetical protein ACOC4G_02525 [Bacillota bacterium]
MYKKRMKTSILTGVLFGLLCVLGFIFRKGFSDNSLFVLALFYNRVLMGIVIGMAAERKGVKVLLRGALLGLIVSLAFYLSTSFRDPITFFSGIVIGLIIDAVASKYDNIIIRTGRKLINKIVD